MPPATYPIPTYSGTNAPSPAAIANRQLTYSVGPSSSQPAPAGTAGTDVGGNEQAASALQAYLNGGTLAPNESSLENTIMGNYNQAKQNTSSAYQGEAQAITNDYQNQADQLNRELGNQMKGELESRSGFATNNAMLRNLQETGQNRIDQLTKQRDEALLNNNQQMADSLNNLIINEQNLITTSRQNMVANLGTAATLQTPGQVNQQKQQQAQQAAVVQMQSQAPDAGISSNDSFDVAVAKYKNSKFYQNNLAEAQATIAQGTAAASASSASAAASAASAAQTRTLTGLIQNGGGNDQQILAALKAGTMTLADLPTVINSTIDPQGVKRITSEWLAQGGNPVQNEASAAATKANAANLGAGGYSALTTGGTNVLGSFLNGAFGSNPVAPATPTRSLSAVASPTKGATTTLNGLLYEFDGTNWNAIGNVSS